jgi:uncharacterized protein (TIGR02118 family)
MWNVKPTMSEAEFEEWYRNQHIADARKIPGLIKYTVNLAVPSNGQKLYYRMAELCFADRATFEAAFASPEWKHAFEDAQAYIADHLRVTFDSTDIPLKDH